VDEDSGTLPEFSVLGVGKFLAPHNQEVGEITFFRGRENSKGQLMGYHIYLDGEKCGELSDTENARLRKEARTDARTWGAFVLAEIWRPWKLFSFYLRILGLIGGVGVLTGMFLAPLILASAQPLSASEIAVGMQQVGLSLCFLAGFSAAGVLVFSPKTFGIPNFFENEYLRRVRKLKNIQRYGELEVRGFTMPQNVGVQ
jgi:hypothetical protein